MSLSPETLPSIPFKAAAAESAGGIIRQRVYELPSLAPRGLPVRVVCAVPSVLSGPASGDTHIPPRGCILQLS